MRTMEDLYKRLVDIISTNAADLTRRFNQTSEEIKKVSTSFVNTTKRINVLAEKLEKQALTRQQEIEKAIVQLNAQLDEILKKK